MRTKFDHGEDPMNPESQQGHHHQHFHGGFQGFQGFNPFGSGPFNFKFNFNWKECWTRTGADFFLSILSVCKGDDRHLKNVGL